MNAELQQTEEYVRLEEISKMLDVKRRTLIDWCQRYEDFPCLRLPGSIRVKPTEVMRWLEQFQRKHNPNGNNP